MNARDSALRSALLVIGTYADLAELQVARDHDRHLVRVYLDRDPAPPLRRR